MHCFRVSNCRVTKGTLRALGKGKLKACCRCKAVQYCSKDYQKAHWKALKKQCNSA